MNIRLFQPSDYSLISSWWKDHEWPSIPLTFLPKTGIIVDDCAVGFLYCTDSKICLLEFVLVDPNADKVRRRTALDVLINEASELAKELGFEAIFASLSHKGLIARYEKHGFKVTDQSTTNLIRMI